MWPGQEESQGKKEGTWGGSLGVRFGGAWDQALYRCFITYAQTALSSLLHPRQALPLPSQPLTDIKRRLFRDRTQRQAGDSQTECLALNGGALLKLCK